MARKVKAAVVGASGYAGMTIVNLLVRHPGVDLVQLTSRSAAGKPFISVFPLLDLEGLKAWCDGRTSGYTPLEGAVDSARFYDQEGAVTARDYRP